jgi:unsaturated rhamnogalacturonyl hydrolase
MQLKAALRCGLVLAILTSCATTDASLENRPWSQSAADSTIARWPQGRFVSPGNRWAWNYELGILLEGMDAVWLNTADPRYFSYLKNAVDPFVGPDGAIATWKPEESQLGRILLGRQLLLLYGVTLDQRYAKAATLLYQQLIHQPRTSSGGYWHKRSYPNQMWLDDLYMAEPFYAEYALTFHHPEAFDDIVHQFELIDTHARDPKTGLLYHGWDESKQERWANPQTGLSSQFWMPAMGYHMMALVDTLAYLPEDHTGRKTLLHELDLDAQAIAKVQDISSGLWYKVPDRQREKGNYFESSAACMVVYALARAVRQGYLPERYAAIAERGYQGILRRFVKTASDGAVSLLGTVKSAGLGGDPYRDGSYSYYIGEHAATDDPKGIGVFLLASVEIENMSNARIGRAQKVLLDAWFNSQKRQDAFGQPVYFHYKWNDQSNSGYSLLGHLFNSFGAETETLYTPPTSVALHNAQVYIIVSPDIPVKNPNPHYMRAEDATEIAQWVNEGGVLVIMENDPGNADLDHLNLLSERFGIHYNKVLRNQVEGSRFEMGKVAIEAGGPVFRNPHTAFMKEICTITETSPASSVLKDRGDTLIAIARYGKGTVLATVDPWFYNEYMDGRILPQDFDNFATARDLVRWILMQTQRH